jgi:hypothetical protein
MSIICRWFQLSVLSLFSFLLLGSGAHAADCPYRGNWSGTWQETSCDNRNYSGKWIGTVDANCFFLGTDEDSSSDLVHGTINPVTGNASLVGYENDCGALTGAADFIGVTMTGTFGGSGVNGSFSGKGTYTPSCNFSLSPAGGSYLSAGGAGAITITAPSGCDWSASENVDWLKFTSATTGSGNGSVLYTVSENTSSNRSAIILVAGKSFMVRQESPVNVGAMTAVLSLLLK